MSDLVSAKLINMIALIDANNFFVSCERAVNPTLQHQPMVVLSNNDGCVISRSNEVKELGIPMGAPYFKYRDNFERNNVIAHSVNFSLYDHFSRKIVRVLQQNCPRVQVYSIDESFVVVPKNLSNKALINWADKLRKQIFKVTCIPASIGVANTKTLAKLAGYTAKKQTTTGQGAGIALISEDNLDQALSDTFIGSIWGIGTKLAHRMRREGIKTARDLVNRDDAWIRSMFGIVGLRMKAELMGSTASLVEIDQTDRQGISSTRSFGRDVCSYQELLASLIKHVEVASRKLRRQNSTAGKISIFIRTGKHKTGPQYYGKTELLLLVPTDNTLNFNKVVRQLLESVYRPGFIYYRSGVLLSNIEPKENHHPQSSWYKTEQHRYQSDTMATIDKLNNIYGNNHIRSACIPKQPSWQSKSNFKSFQQSLKDTTKLPTLHIV